MSDAGDVVVVGAGIIGCAIARALAARGAGVTVVEATRISAGATQASAGVLAPYIEAPSEGPLLDLTTRSLELYDDFIASLASEGWAVEFARCGTIEMASDAAAAERLSALQRRFPDRLEWLDCAAVRESEPAVRTGVEGALLARTHGYVRVPQLVDALAGSAARRGVRFEEGSRVVSIRSASGGLEVVTEARTLRAAQVVLACGSWADQIEIEGAAPEGIRPVRGQLVRIGWDGPPLSHVLWGPDCYIVPWRDNTLLVGATVEDAGFDQRTTVAGVRALMTAACDLLPNASHSAFVEARAGLRPGSADGLPVVGPSERLEGLTYAVGHYRNGILLAPWTADVVAAWILERRRDASLGSVAPGR